MTPMIKLTIIMAVVFVAYALWIAARWGVLSSISASSYKLEGNARYVFTGWLVLLGVLNLFHYEQMGVWAGLMSMGLALAGITIDHKQAPDLEDEFHTWGTILAIAAGFLGLVILHSIWLPAALFVAVGLLLFAVHENWIWWTEIAATIGIVSGYLEIYMS